MSACLDWNFYATESSVLFKLMPNSDHAYWVEAHVHFGRFGTVPVMVMITSHRHGIADGVAFLEQVLTDLFWQRIPAFFRQRGPGVGVELQPSIYYFGIRLQCDVLAYDHPNRLDLPTQARGQIERILNCIPPEELSPLAQGIPANEASATETPATETPATETPATETPATEVSAAPAPKRRSRRPRPPEPSPWDESLPQPGQAGQPGRSEAPAAAQAVPSLARS